MEAEEMEGRIKVPTLALSPVKICHTLTSRKHTQI